MGKHPTQKPVELIARCLRATTDPGDLVLDPFAGSGSTGVAALNLSRSFVGYEQNQTYAQLAARRLSETAPDQLAIGKSSTPRVVRKGQQTLFAKV